MKITTPIILLAIILLSCTSIGKKKIVGNWYKLDDWVVTGINDTIPKEYSSPRPPIYYPFGFSFKKNDSVEYFLGTWDRNDNQDVYLGDYRKYEVNHDSLVIYNHRNEVFRAYKYEFQNKDTLILSSPKGKYAFVRFYYEELSGQKIDSIKIRNTDGYSRDIEYKIYSDGTIFLRDHSSYYEKDLNLNCKGKIEIKTFKRIEKMYNRADFKKLKDYDGCCDGDLFEVRIYYDGLEKQIIDYMNSGPMQFVWANAKLIRLIESKLRKKEC